MNLDDFTNKPMTLAEVEALRRGKVISKGPSRLEVAIVKDQIAVIDEKRFRAAVVNHDGNVCRWCGCVVIVTLKRQPNRREIHHVHGRRGVLRFEVRAALVLCCECHEKVTGRVNERWVIVATKTFVLRGQTYTNARAKVNFKKAA